MSGYTNHGVSKGRQLCRHAKLLNVPERDRAHASEGFSAAKLLNVPERDRAHASEGFSAAKLLNVPERDRAHASEGFSAAKLLKVPKRDRAQASEGFSAAKLLNVSESDGAHASEGFSAAKLLRHYGLIRKFPVKDQTATLLSLLLNMPMPMCEIKKVYSPGEDRKFFSKSCL